MCFYGSFLRVKPRLCLSIGCCLCVRYAQTCTNRHTYNTATFSLVHSLIPICSSNSVLCTIRSFFLFRLFHFIQFQFDSKRLLDCLYICACVCVCVIHTVHKKVYTLCTVHVSSGLFAAQLKANMNHLFYTQSQTFLNAKFYLPLEQMCRHSFFHQQFK